MEGTCTNSIRATSPWVCSGGTNSAAPRAIARVPTAVSSIKSLVGQRAASSRERAPSRPTTARARSTATSSRIQARILSRRRNPSSAWVAPGSRGDEVGGVRVEAGHGPRRGATGRAPAIAPAQLGLRCMPWLAAPARRWRAPARPTWSRTSATRSEPTSGPAAWRAPAAAWSFPIRWRREEAGRLCGADVEVEPAQDRRVADAHADTCSSMTGEPTGRVYVARRARLRQSRWPGRLSGSRGIGRLRCPG